MLHGFKAMPCQGFSRFQSEGNILKALLGFALMSALPQPAPLTDTVGGFFFPSCSTCAWLSDTSECDSAAIAEEKQQSPLQRFPRRGPGGPPYVQAGRSSLYFTQEQRSGFIAGPNTPDYDGNVSCFLFCVFI